MGMPEERCIVYLLLFCAYVTNTFMHRTTGSPSFCPAVLLSEVIGLTLEVRGTAKPFRP
jgi:hypothetical protein